MWLQAIEEVVIRQHDFMSEPNTLFLLAKHGLKSGSELGLLESWMWNLTEEEQSMKFVSLHRSKSDRANKGGQFVSIREATNTEIREHQDLLRSLDKDLMQVTDTRMIIVFRVDRKWNKIWASSDSHQMAYKGLGYVDIAVYHVGQGSR
jgi:hypothetical protein